MSWEWDEAPSSVKDTVGHVLEAEGVEIRNRGMDDQRLYAQVFYDKDESENFGFFDDDIIIMIGYNRPDIAQDPDIRSHDPCFSYEYKITAEEIPEEGKVTVTYMGNRDSLTSFAPYEEKNVEIPTDLGETLSWELDREGFLLWETEPF